VSGFLGFLVIIPVGWQFLHQYQKERVLTFLHIINDPRGTSYNVIQSIYAVGSGKFLGKGLGQGTQSALKFLPERQTDFLFATLSEMLGFVGAAVLIVCFALLLYRCFTLIQHTEEDFCKVFIIGAFFLLLIQFFVNVGMNIGILPIVGVTFPFVSYGGSSFIANAILLGLVSGMSKKHITKQVLEIR
jgi:rod shape determining protein RodA